MRNERQHDELRTVEIIPHVNKHAEGSVLISIGDTKVICTATVEERVPNFLRGKKQGWINAEYAMLPRATGNRTVRESVRGKQTGRTMEIQRLISRSLRSVVDLERLGERTIWIDCDVIQADGGTRTASITGGFCALVLAVDALIRQGKLGDTPIKEGVAAISVGRTNELLLDLNYEEDAAAEVDMNVVMTASGRFVEVQGTGEEATFTLQEMNEMLQMAQGGIETLFKAAEDALGASWWYVGEQMEETI
ncbi:ribonuclease PH [Exiguobacterium sp. SH3S2]|uniref:ribonuclease PH n=1 Tax=Exiguobacterium TaxID=33986 RepID=UPI000877816F|nr:MULTISPECIES: ribonuclease PH [Exiguobacterium]TCI37603.1 ribonuclease PH [Exiguobacterium sp. SH4S7]TCI43365.1 ribonuclease PH [Exiguobacterium sp. SH3S3]TCI45936.1 ribonuclease PH [Exiguobacterium sp. SH5S32]TCI51693.1 ribonuclease PH [Exiguobacterium sp. SH1S4]TCI59211.1 ribonuclease PH [Exiguobacterium sp. SH3S2]